MSADPAAGGALHEKGQSRGTLIDRPGREALRSLALEMPNAKATPWGGVAVRARVRHWSCDATSLVSRRPARSTHSAVSRREAGQVAALQDRYSVSAPMILLDAAIGHRGACRLRMRLLVEARWASIAAVQDLLWFPPPTANGPEATVICTPGLRVPGYPQGRAVIVDLERGVTRICGTDFAGEPKRAGLRMWSKRAWELGGLPLHAAAVTSRAGDDPRPALLVGRPGTGKSTLALADRAAGAARQEDRVAWMPDGALVLAEHAFFSPLELAGGASTAVRAAVCAPGSYLLDPPTGRVVFGPDPIVACGAGDGRPRAIILLVRNQNVLPAVTRLDRESAAAVYIASLEGEAVADGRLQRLGANPLFPLSAVAQGARLLDLLTAHGAEAYVMNTGRIGGPPQRPGSRDIEVRHSAAIVAALLSGAGEWEADPSLGCEVAHRLPGIEARDAELLHPRALYERQGRADEHAALVRRLTGRWSECAAQLRGLGSAAA